MTARRGRTVHLTLATGALVLGALAATSGDASSRAAAARRTEITALELAREIRNARSNLRLIDLRDAESFDAFSIPGAERMTVDGLMRARWDAGANVIVYADSAAAAWHAQEALHSVGVRGVRVLKGGVAEWVNTIVSPVLPPNPSPEQAAASREIAEMSRWFGGVPHVGEPHVTTGDSVRAALGRIRRRGC